MNDALVGAAAGSENGSEQQGPAETVPVDSLLSLGSPRLAGEDARHVQVMAESDDVLPPIVVHRPTMRVVDGAHRLRAAALRGEDRIEARFVDGTAEDAFVLAVQLNSRHGMPLSQADRTAATLRIIKSHPQWSDRQIAEVTGVSRGSVAALRACSTGQDGQLNVRTGRDGRVRPVNGAEGRRRAGRYVVDRPDASLREIAKAADVAVATARDVRERLRRGEDPVPPKLRAAEKSGASEQQTPVPDVAFRASGAVNPRAHLAPPLATHSTVESLCKDPSVRFSEAGRTLLRLLSTQAMETERWRWLAERVPKHRTSDVAQVAHRCAEQWLQFARHLELRNAETRGQAG